MKGSLARFVVATLTWLPVTFAIWYLAAPLILWPAKLIAQAVALAGFGNLVREVSMEGAIVTFATTLRPGQGVPGAFVSVDVNLLLYAFGLPMLAALTLATRGTRRVRNLAIGYAAVLPFVAFGALADFLKNVAISAGPLVASQAGFSPLQRELIAFAFQFGSLILPTVAPAAIWVLLHRPFLERLRDTASGAAA